MGMAELEELAARLSTMVGTPVDCPTLRRALTHRSYSYEHHGAPHNERLEFLGDSVLGLVVTDTLFRDYPEISEGQLAKLRAAVVNSRALAHAARELGLGPHIMLGKGEQASGGADKSSILADTLEAVIGAVYIACGLSAADRLIHALVDPLIATSSRMGAALDWKTSLQELAAAEGLGVPVYDVCASGPDHDKHFTAEVVLGDKRLGHGEGRSKKTAEQVAAEAAWREINQGTRPEPQVVS